jgi:small subunit ribosomal protein S24e
MELEIRDKRENTLLKRTEINFVLHHPNSPTPKRDHAREEISKALKVPKDRVVVDHMESSFGNHDTSGYAKIYASKEDALKFDNEHILLRNRLVEKKAAEAPKEG